MASKKANILRKLKLYNNNPELVKEIPNNELADLVLVVMGAVEAIDEAIKAGRLDGYTPQETKDYVGRKEATAYLTSEVNKMLAKADDALTITSKELEKRVQQAIDNIRDGDDGIVTEEEIIRAAQIAFELIELPDFDALVEERITANPMAVRDSLETITEEKEKLAQSAISGLLDTVAELRSDIAKAKSGQGGGGISQQRVLQLIAENGGGGGGHTIQEEGSNLPQRTNLNFVGSGVTATDDSGNDATVVTINTGAVDETADYDWTGQHTFTDLRIPTSATPSVTVDGDVAVDTTVTGLSHGIQRFYAGEELFNLALPVAQLAALNNGYIPKYNATTDEFELQPDTSGGGDTVTTYLNTEYKDSSGGTADTHGALAGAINGSNTLFTVSRSQYVSGTLSVYRNGKRLIQGTSEDWTETNPAAGTFTFAVAPVTGDIIDVEYHEQETTSAALIVEKDVTTVSTTYTILPTDRVVLVNAAAGAVTVTLPALSGVDSVGVTIKKIDTSGNIVTIATPNTETIDNFSEREINTYLQSRTIISDGSNYWQI